MALTLTDLQKMIEQQDGLYPLDMYRANTPRQGIGSVNIPNVNLQGAPNVSPEDYADRLDACKACPHLKEKFMRCGLCGCMIQHKAKWKTTTCPDKPERWAKQEDIPNEEE